MEWGVSMGFGSEELGGLGAVDSDGKSGWCVGEQGRNDSPRKSPRLAPLENPHFLSSHSSPCVLSPSSGHSGPVFQMSESSEELGRHLQAMAFHKHSGRALP